MIGITFALYISREVYMFYLKFLFFLGFRGRLSTLKVKQIVQELENIGLGR